MKSNAQGTLGRTRNRPWKLILGASLVLGVWCLEFPLRVHAQGSLTPPGAPTPSMKSLDQIEARTPISSLPFTISARGSYYLTQRLSVSSGNAITINASGVTLDLNGFTITSTAASATGTAILINGAFQNITILNGFIQGGVTQSGGSYSGSGFARGVYYNSAPTNVRVSGISVSGCLSDGINLGFNSTIVQSCTINTVGGYGIYAQTVSDSAAMACGFDGLQVQTAHNCRGDSVSGGTGVYANLAATNCAGTSVSNDGLYALNATNCYGSTSTGMHGLNAFSANNCYGYHGGSGSGVNADEVQNSYGQSVSGAGINATSATGCYGTSNTSFGINANSVTASYGFTSNSSAIKAKTVEGSYGESATGNGIHADNVSGSYGVTTSGFGISASTASNCYATAASGTGIAPKIMARAHTPFRPPWLRIVTPTMAVEAQSLSAPSQAIVTGPTPAPTLVQVLVPALLSVAPDLGIRSRFRRPRNFSAHHKPETRKQWLLKHQS